MCVCERQTVVLRAVSQLPLGPLPALIDSGQRLAASLMAWRPDRDVACDRYLRMCLFPSV